MATDLLWTTASRLLRQRASTGVPVLVLLSLGLSSVLAVTSAVRAVLLAPLPYPRGERLIALSLVRPDRLETRFSYPQFMTLRRGTNLPEGVAAYQVREGTAAIANQIARRIIVARVTGEFFHVLRVPAHRGRTLLPEDDRAGARHVVVLTESFAIECFGNATRALGSSVRIDQGNYSVIGVVEDEYGIIGNRIGAYVPLGAELGPVLHIEGPGFLHVVGRLSPNMPLAISIRRLSVEAAGLTFGTAREPILLRSEGLHSRLFGRSRLPLLLLSGSSMVVLLLCCVNCINLLLAMLLSREGEFATRWAFGATRRVLGRQLLIEVLPLALLGSVLSVPLAWLQLRALVLLAPADLATMRVQLGVATWTGSAGLAVACLIAVVAAPLLRVREAQGTWLQRATTGTATSSPRHAAVRRLVLVVATLFASGLVALASCLTLTLVAMQRQPLGFKADGVLTARVARPYAIMFSQDISRQRSFARTLLARAAELEGRPTVALAAGLPTTLVTTGVPIQLATPEAGPALRLDVNLQPVSSAYFDVLGIHLEAGRTFTPADDDAPVTIGILEQSTARVLCGGRRCLGRRISGQFPGEFAEIIGIVEDVRVPGRSDALGRFYIPFAKLPLSDLRVFLRLRGGPSLSAANLVELVRDIDPHQPVTEVVPLRRIIRDALARPRLVSVWVALFGLVAGVLGALGVLSIVAFSLARRRKEIAVWVTLGATPLQVAGLLSLEPLVCSAFGAAIGALLAFSSAKAIAASVYGTQTLAMGGLLAGALGFAAVVGVTSFVPGYVLAMRSQGDALKAT